MFRDFSAGERRTVNGEKFFTSESVTEGHPDKICDQISDAVLDVYAKDPYARVACEAAITTGMVLIIGEITANCSVDIPGVARETILEIGYDSSGHGFDGNTCAVLVSIDEQSSDIAIGVDQALEARSGKMEDPQIEAIGAGDQGMMFGFACNETPELMPMPVSLAHKLTRRLAEVRKNGTIAYLKPDGKSQVTVEYDGDKPVRVDTVVVSAQHEDKVPCEKIEQDVIRHVIKEVIPSG